MKSKFITLFATTLEEQGDQDWTGMYIDVSGVTHKITGQDGNRLYYRELTFWEKIVLFWTRLKIRSGYTEMKNAYKGRARKETYEQH